ncbi:hypothetical protein [Olsenella sp. HMSC062G07]|uniref:hypothetical protein n=1 Tax=Olsenella sp. HMSC062G07 TaxID=1739330 RepID=UPI0008A27E3B|nr:hypothetical protein [Olsenella sp. HMSC062G07]OFK22804.1 hypothetical protein HMPREF2826_00795 [Olsenella sp. HMSC062G07]
MDTAYLFDLHAAIMLLFETHGLRLDMSRHDNKVEGLPFNLDYDVWHRKDAASNGMFDQRLVDFLTMCAHDYDKWVARGLGSSVNETNASGRKFGDVEYLSLEDRRAMHVYEAHGGGLRDEYVQDHINSLVGTVDYFKNVAEDRGERFERDVEVAYVAHDVSRLIRFKDGHAEEIGSIPFTFRFMTFYDLLEEAGGIDYVSEQTDLFDELVHHRISRLPDSYSLKQRYLKIISKKD